MLFCCLAGMERIFLYTTTTFFKVECYLEDSLQLYTHKVNHSLTADNNATPRFFGT